MRRLLALLLSAFALPAGIGATFSAFSAETTNSGNSFVAAGSFGPVLRMASGTYTGNGADNRAIAAGFQPDVVIVKATNNQVGVIRTSSITGDNTKSLTGATALAANEVQSLDANGFTVGTDAQVNGGGNTYHWIALKAAAGVLGVGSYTGNGSTSRSISGVGFAPEYVALLPATAQRASQRYAGMTRGFQFDNDTGTTTRVTSLDGDGFSVGGSAEANSNGATYHYVAINEVAGAVDAGSYTGDGTATRNLTGLGFQPAYVSVRANDTATGRQGQHRPAAQADPSSLFYGATAQTTSGIRSLLTDGFQVGNNAAVNNTGVTYHYLGLKDTAGG